MRRALAWSLGLHAGILAAALLARCHAHVDATHPDVAIEIDSAATAPAPVTPVPTPAIAGPGPRSAASAHRAPAPRGGGVARSAASGAVGSPIGSMDVEERGGGAGPGGLGGGGGAGFGGGDVLFVSASAAAITDSAKPLPPPPPPKISKARPARLVYPGHEGDGGHLFSAIVTVDEDGYVVGVELEHTGAAREDEAAESAWRFRYDPARDDDGHPIRSRVEQQFFLGE